MVCCFTETHQRIFCKFKATTSQLPSNQYSQASFLSTPIQWIDGLHYRQAHKAKRYDKCTAPIRAPHPSFLRVRARLREAIPKCSHRLSMDASHCDFTAIRERERERETKKKGPLLVIDTGTAENACIELPQ